MFPRSRRSSHKRSSGALPEEDSLLRRLDWRDSDPVPCGGWVSAMVDAAWAGPSGVAMFNTAVRVVLDESRKEPAAKPKAALSPRWAQPTGQGKSLRALAILTRDLDATAPTMKALAPRLWHLLSKVDSDARKRVSTTRRNWCKSLGGKVLIPRIVAFWREDAVRFVPDPGASTAKYSESADWLAAVHEINPAAASKLRASWATIYATSGATSTSGAFRFHPVSGEPAPRRLDGWIRRGLVATHFGLPLGDPSCVTSLHVTSAMVSRRLALLVKLQRAKLFPIKYPSNVI